MDLSELDRVWVSFLNPSYRYLISQWIDTTLSSPLLAAFSDSTAIIADTSIWHSSSAKDTSILQPVLDIYSTGFSQVGTSQIDILHHGFFELSSGQVGIGQIDINKNGLGEVSSFESGTPENSVSQVGLGNFSSNQQGFGQISPNQGAIQNGTAEVGTTQISTIQTAISLKIGASKDSFSSTVSSEQFLSSDNVVLHDWLLAPVNSALNSTVVSLWQGFQPNFDLTIEVTDLPTGQLAEANITGFGPTGSPNAGTLYLDTDANGLGWYIDPTPWDNSEYSQTLTDTAYRATADSAAYGHYCQKIFKQFWSQIKAM
jgi:hypothetical protein